MNNLKYFRKKYGKTQKDIADLLGMTQTAYGNYELGKRTISPENLSTLADYYGISVDELMGRIPLEDYGKHLEEIPELQPEDEVYLPLDHPSDALTKRLADMEASRDELRNRLKSLTQSDSAGFDAETLYKSTLELTDRIKRILSDLDATDDDKRNALSLFIRSIVVSESRKVIFNYTLPKVGHQYDSVPPSLNKNMSGVGSQSAHNPSAPPVGEYSHAQRITLW